MVPPKGAGLWSRLSNVLLLKLPRFVEVARYAVRHVRTLDVVIVPGSGLLQDYWSQPWQLPITLYLWCLSARLCGKKLGFVSVGCRHLAELAKRMAAEVLGGFGSVPVLSRRGIPRLHGRHRSRLQERSDLPDIVFTRYEPAIDTRPEIGIRDPW